MDIHKLLIANAAPRPVLDVRGVFLFDPGSALVSSAMAMTGVVVSSGGSQYIYRRGVTISNGVLAGGYQWISSGGVASATEIVGGSQYVSAGGRTVDTVLSGGWQSVDPASVASGTVVSSGGVQFVYGTANGTVVSSGGSANVYGNANGTVVDDGAKIWVFSGGVAVDCVVSSGGSVMIAAGGSALNPNVTGVGGGAGDIRMDNGGYVSGGVIVSTNIALRAGATAIGVNLSTNAYMITYGDCTALSPVASGDPTGSARILCSCGYVSGAVIGAYGYMSIQSRTGYDLPTVIDTTVLSGGRVGIYSGTTQSGAVISSGGSMFVSSGGTALAVTSSAGAIITVNDGGYIEYV